MPARPLGLSMMVTSWKMIMISNLRRMANAPSASNYVGCVTLVGNTNDVLVADLVE
jgi:hypothetical protein